MLNIDLWYGDNINEITGASATFYPNEGEYRGNLYKGDKMIGDYSSDDSVQLEEFITRAKDIKRLDALHNGKFTIITDHGNKSSYYKIGLPILTMIPNGHKIYGFIQEG